MSKVEADSVASFCLENPTGQEILWTRKRKVFEIGKVFSPEVDYVKQQWDIRTTKCCYYGISMENREHKTYVL